MMPKSGIDASRVSPAFFVDLADPLGEVYRHCEEALLENIAKHFNVKADETYSFKWQVKKLSELGRLSLENVKIIAQVVSDGDEMTRLALEQSMLRAIAEVEPDLLDASRAGLIGEAQPLAQSERLKSVMDAYRAQAVDKLNLVNTVMLNSSLDQYRKTVANVGMYEQQLAAAQEILNERTGEIVTGQTSLREAVRRGVQDLARTGLTGFTDRAGHAWSPEAYVTMDLRTTAHNVAIECARARMGDYGTQIFQVSEHVGARPKCAPYQGKCYAWDNTAGEIEDGIGNRIRFEPLSSTSYGQPDGLFGINCGHRPIVVIPGQTIVRKRIQQSEAENAGAYKLSQQQRRLEREVRGAKREAALLKASGDAEGFKHAAQKVARRNAAMAAFIDDTGRTRRRDREQVVGFDRSLSASVNAANRIELAKYTSYRYNKDGTIKVTDDWKSKLHQSTPKEYKPYAVVETTSANGKGIRQVDRTYYGPDAVITKQVHTGPHGNAKAHNYGKSGEHMHTYVWGEDGKPDRRTMDIDERTRKENSDILDR